MKLGKVETEILENIVFRWLGKRRDDVLQGAGVGIDNAALKVEDKIIIASSDPVTGAIEYLGWIAVHVAANDVAVAGGEPAWYLPIILMPPSTDRDELEKVCREMHEAAESIGASIVGGHTEYTDTVTRIIVCGTFIGPLVSDRYISSSGAKPGDRILVVGYVGMEGTGIIARDFQDRLRYLNEKSIKEAQRYIKEISIVEPAIIAAKSGLVNAMHDPTEGGLLGGIHEMCDASNVGFRIYRDEIPLSDSTIRICKEVNVDPLKLLSSGTLLISTPEKEVDILIERLRETGKVVREIGEIVKNPDERILVSKEGERRVGRPIRDEIWKLWS